MSKTGRTQEQYLMDILEKIEKIRRKIGVNAYRDFIEDEDLVDIIFLNVMIIGEAISQIDLDLLYKTNSDKRYWRRIKDTRNYLIHEYHGVNLKILYGIATKELEELENYVREMLEKVR